jgi:hypothetical protein
MASCIAISSPPTCTSRRGCSRFLQSDADAARELGRRSSAIGKRAAPDSGRVRSCRKAPKRARTGGAVGDRGCGRALPGSFTDAPHRAIQRRVCCPSRFTLGGGGAGAPPSPLLGLVAAILQQRGAPDPATSRPASAPAPVAGASGISSGETALEASALAPLSIGRAPTVSVPAKGRASPTAKPSFAPGLVETRPSATLPTPASEIIRGLPADLSSPPPFRGTGNTEEQPAAETPASDPGAGSAPGRRSSWDLSDVDFE